jgi:hypothetical protein
MGMASPQLLSTKTGFEMALGGNHGLGNSIRSKAALRGADLVRIPKSAPGRIAIAGLPTFKPCCHHQGS